jgi:hypothetical protein
MVPYAAFHLLGAARKPGDNVQVGAVGAQFASEYK